MGTLRDEGGYAMAAMLVAIAVMGVLLSVAMTSWRQLVQREKEAELIFRAEQYQRAINLYQRKVPGAFPPNVDFLLQQKYLRKKYQDPMVPDGQFQVVPPTPVAPGTPPSAQAVGFGGVISKSKEKAFRLYKGRAHYNEWSFRVEEYTPKPPPIRIVGQPGQRAPGGLAPGSAPRPGGPTAPGKQPGPGTSPFTSPNPFGAPPKPKQP